MQIRVQLLIVVLTLLQGADGSHSCFQGGFSLICHKEEINGRSCGAPATIPLQISMDKPCLPPDPSAPKGGGASSERISQRRLAERHPPVGEPACSRTVPAPPTLLVQPVTD